MMYYSLFFEARGIQSYIFDSGKMKDMVGGSELVKRLCDEDLNEVVNHLGLKEVVVDGKQDSSKLKNMKNDEVFFSRRNGGAFTAILADKAMRDRFLELWSILVSVSVPGLEAVNAVFESEDLRMLIKSTYGILGFNRNCPSVILPEATPMHVLAPRTGKPAVENRYEAGGSRVWTDAATAAKLDAAEKKGSCSLEDSFLPANRSGWKFPLNLEFDSDGNCDFPFRSDSRYLGLVHADGNGLGQSLLKIQESFSDGAEYAVMLRLFSDRLGDSTREAAQIATDKLIAKFEAEGGFDSRCLPLRPLVLGGDDLTVLVRADYAMQFTEDYCKAFEEVTQKNFSDLHKTSGKRIPAKLTACAGIAYIKNNQPFMDAFELAESLCSASKEVSKSKNRETIPATVTSMVVSNSFIESYESYKNKELTANCKDGKKRVATLGAYAFDDSEREIPTLKSLRNLCSVLKDDGVTPSSIRQYATMIFGDENLSREKYRRWTEILKKRNKFGPLADCLKEFGIENAVESPWTEDGKTPIFDALQLMTMENKEETRK